MIDDMAETFVEMLTWPMLAAIFALSAAWDICRGEVRFGDYLQFDHDDTGPFIILVGLKFVAAILILITYYSS